MNKILFHLLMFFLWMSVFSISFPCRGKAEQDDWLTDHDQALQKAKSEKKMLLMDFTGSDWCTWCMMLEKGVLSGRDFKEYAQKNLVLEVVDFPRGKDLPEKEEKQNKKLLNQFDPERFFPTLVVLDPEGRKIRVFEGDEAASFLTPDLLKSEGLDPDSFGIKFVGPKGLTTALKKLKQK